MTESAGMKPMTKLVINILIIMVIAMIVSMMIDMEMTDPDTKEVVKKSLWAHFLDRSGLKKS